MQKQITYKDAVIHITASAFGSIQITVKCRGYEHTFTPELFAELVYPAIDQAAKPYDAPPLK